jgi:uncharacterized OB-fold protein/putative sterol carrier protein
MSEYDKVTVNDIFNTMPDRFRPEGAAGVDASFGYDIKGAGQWRLTIRDGSMKLEKGADLSGCVAVLRTDPDTFLGVNLGKIDGSTAMSAGRLTVKGDLVLFGRTSRMFKKFIVPGETAQSEEELLCLKRVISVKQRFATGPVMGKFLKALKEKIILAIKCPVCGRLQSPPREVCAVCRVRNREWVEIGPGGEMRMLEYCYYASPDPLTGESRETPYGAAGILLDGCKDEEVFWHLIRPDQLDRVKMGIVLGDKVIPGSRLRPVWAEKRTGSIEDIKYFEIDD